MRNTTLCYITRDDCYLMLHRVKRQNDINRDKWVGLGGGFKNGESPEDCLLREVFEESGLHLTSYRLRGLITFVTDRQASEYMFLYTADEFQGEITDCDEGCLEWIPIAEVASLPLWEGDHIFFRLLAEDRPFFSLKLVYIGDKLQSAILDGQMLHLS